MIDKLKEVVNRLLSGEKEPQTVEEEGKSYVVVQPDFMDKEIIDVNGVPLTKEETQEYWDDVFDGGIPMSSSYARDYLWPKWGVRLGIPKPE